MHHSRSLNYTFLLNVYNNKRGLICLGERQVATKRAEDDSERLLCRPVRTSWKRLYNWYKSTDDNKIWLHVCEKFNLQLSLGNLVKLNSYLTFIDIRMTLTFIADSKHTSVHSKIVQQWSIVVVWEVFTTVNVCTSISPHLWWRAFLARRHFWHRLKQFYPDMKDFVQFW